ncbi:MAG: tRNA (adenosine(37)-N6)-threonylcarbamoyltransferase complex dimerization subunit type 1 TsaB [Betaproteobacteria bacterium]|nr:tRNA (adenosine(37)-N6)-threonylcarbamoyltransferase complex dimerization subunit type 1 TsaB [Betaproteobacteria bacterium]MBI2509468.1 tRNA (adenosine(37)-N6)-threonylcarbamoyltransferase complex dimerization subunit type 1 TsaB [Betaproteobacteria bacterium]
MKILALDTSTEYCSAALWRDGEVDARDALAGQRHSELLLPMVDGLLGRHGLRVVDLDGIAFGQGPGSFTGLRIACGVTQGLAFGAGLPVVGVSTLLGLAHAARVDRAVCCLDARMGGIYLAAYDGTAGRWSAVREPILCAPAEAPLLPAGAWTGCGSGFAAHEAALRQRYGGQLSAVMPRLFPHARDIVQLAVHEFEQGRAVPAGQAAPVYLRDKVALKSNER